MSTPHVAADTLALAAAEGLKVVLLPIWYDVDDAAALARLCGELADASTVLRPIPRPFCASMAIS